MAYCIYLRKSRKDMEAEARGEGETLARHDRILKDLARRMNYPIVKIYREIVSGESIANRPQMRQMLADVAARKYEGILVMEVERLARGDIYDQAAVASTFKYSNTRIITPQQIYDPSGANDEVQFEFSLFMSRCEYKTITRRIQTGRKFAAKEGRYIASRPPYGYRRIHRPDGIWTLEIIPEQAEIVRQIFDWYAHGYGGGKVAARLNAMGVRTQMDKQWAQHTIARMIHNPVYIGYITWSKRIDTITGVDEYGVKQHKRLHNDNPICVRGYHEPIVSDELFAAANSTGREGSMPKRVGVPTQNPLAGLVHCALCGHHMVRTPGTLRPDGTRYPDRITCRTQGCTNYGCSIESLTSTVLNVLHDWSVSYVAAPEKCEAQKANTARDQAKQHLAQLESQRSRLCDLLERRIYDDETYMQRSVILANQISAAREELKHIEAETEKPDPDALIRAIAPRCQEALESFAVASTADEKNRILRTLINHIVFRKTERGNNHDDKLSTVQITIYPFGVSSD